MIRFDELEFSMETSPQDPSPWREEGTTRPKLL